MAEATQTRRETFMTRDQRERELLTLMRNPAGRHSIPALYRKAMGTPATVMLPLGILHSQMIQAILDREYPRNPVA
jgi:hypothetical protein